MFRNPLNKALATAKRHYKYNAKRKGRAFELDDTLFRLLVFGSCFYCGASPVAQGKLIHGIDRVDNTIGYVQGNVVTACSLCNTMKYNLPLQVFLDQCRAIGYNLGLSLTDQGDCDHGTFEKAAA